ncbi:MAG: S8 family serine peptidase [Candidatus Cybelea sp.]
MLRSFKLFAPAAALAIAGCNAGGLTVPGTIGQPMSEAHAIPRWQAQNLAHRACPESRPGEVQCELLILNGSSRIRGSPQGNPYGWGAADIEAAYNLPWSSKGSGHIVAIVDAYDNPKVGKDLAKYRARYGLPTAKFFKYNQDGEQRHYPKGDPSWGMEIDTDVDMVSASCPNCAIYLVEANSNDVSDLETAETEAVKLGARITSNSFQCGSSFDCGDPNFPSYFDTPGVTYVAAAGDDGYAVSEPMALPSVVSVGGTVLSRSRATYSEVVWPDTGGGCVVRIAKPSWQHDPGCSGRTANDVAAVAWNVAIYDTYDEPGWFGIGGTSVAAPIVGGAFALAGNATKQDGGRTFWTLTKKRLKNDLHVISSGTDNSCPPSLAGSYLCTAGTRQYKTYSGPTGWGAPRGIGAF